MRSVIATVALAASFGMSAFGQPPVVTAPVQKEKNAEQVVRKIWVYQATTPDCKYCVRERLFLGQKDEIERFEKAKATNPKLKNVEIWHEFQTMVEAKHIEFTKGLIEGSPLPREKWRNYPSVPVLFAGIEKGVPLLTVDGWSTTQMVSYDGKTVNMQDAIKLQIDKMLKEPDATKIKAVAFEVK